MALKKTFISDCIVTKKKILSPLHAIITLKPQYAIPDILPGQFINILISKTSNIILRRPFSIYDFNSDHNTFSIYIKAIGTGSQTLYNANINDSFNVIYPLGNSFSLLPNKKVLLIGGGYGIAPLYLLAKYLFKKKNNINILMGAKSEVDVFMVKDFTEFGKVFITTENGTSGETGLVTQHSILKNDTFDYLFACGPHEMMKSVSKWAEVNEINCEVSLENFMPCGFGICLCCIAKTINGNLRTCIDGPVFNAKEIIW